MLALDALGLDLPLARWLGNGRGFPLRDHWVLSTVLHSGARSVGWLVLLALTLCTVRPVGIFAAMAHRERVWMVASIWLSIVLIAVVKGISTSACPWDLVEFGGTTPTCPTGPGSQDRQPQRRADTAFRRAMPPPPLRFWRYRCGFIGFNPRGHGGPCGVFWPLAWYWAWPSRCGGPTFSATHSGVPGCAQRWPWPPSWGLGSVKGARYRPTGRSAPAQRRAPGLA